MGEGVMTGYHHSIMGEPGLERWEDQPHNRLVNNGLGLCNTGSGRRIVCAFGGIGCNVDHAWIAFNHVQSQMPSQAF
jgi:hypothetical protein